MTVVKTWKNRQDLVCTITKAGRILIPSVSYEDKELWSTTVYTRRQAEIAIDLFLQMIETQTDHQ